MTNTIFSDEVHKDCDSNDPENILRSLVDENGICRTCGHDHSFTAHNTNKAALYLIGVDLDNQKYTLSTHSELVEALRKHGYSNCISLLKDIMRKHSGTKIVHESYTHPTLVESNREKRPGRPRIGRRI